MTKNEQNYIFLDILSLEDNHLEESSPTPQARRLQLNKPQISQIKQIIHILLSCDSEDKKIRLICLICGFLLL